MGLYRIEGGCLYRIKIGRYHTALSREAPLSVHPASERQHQHQQHTGSSTSNQHQQQRSCLRPTHVAWVPWRPTSPPFPSPLQPSSSISLSPPFALPSRSFLHPFLHPVFSLRLLFSLDSGKYRAHHEGITGKWWRGGRGRKEHVHESCSKERKSTVCAPCMRARGEERRRDNRIVAAKWREPVDDSGRALNHPRDLIAF